MKFLFLLFLSLVSLSSFAHEITYRIVSYNDDAEDFVLAACGEKPEGATAYFENEFGATRGNRFNQIPRNREARLWLYGWEGCKVNAITFSMCSNNKAGTVGFSVNDGDTEVYKMTPVDFADERWFGQWVSKDLGIYVDITKELSLEALASHECSIIIKGGTPEGSVYLNSITISYDAPEGISLESPLGWVFEKLEKKSTLAEGDVLMLYRSGDAAADIDGMEKSHYLDAIGISSTTNVVEPDVELFTINRDESGAHWTMTDQYGRALGATGAQALAWDNGVTTWDITLGYDGATIASTNSKYGTLRYNAPSGSWPRFWNYTSTSLSLPYAYRRVRQIEPTTCSSLNLTETERTVEFGSQDTLVVKTEILPVNTTDRRLVWSSSNSEVATVKSGIVNIHAVGETVISVASADGGATAELHLVVVEPSGIEYPVISKRDGTVFNMAGQITNSADKGIRIQNGRKFLTK